MYRKIQDFFDDWDYESKSTIKIFNNLTDESLAVKVSPDVRTLGVLAWHITLTLDEMMSKTGLHIDSPPQDSKHPSSVQEIKTTYERASESLVNEIKKKWNDDSLQTEVDMYGSNWKNGVTLGALLGHQAHHRGQMTILMRQAGLKVPGIYGPSKEEWAAMGMPPME